MRVTIYRCQIQTIIKKRSLFEIFKLIYFKKPPIKKVLIIIKLRVLSDDSVLIKCWFNKQAPQKVLIELSWEKWALKSLVFLYFVELYLAIYDTQNNSINWNKTTHYEDIILSEKFPLVDIEYDSILVISGRSQHRWRTNQLKLFMSKTKFSIYLFCFYHLLVSTYNH